MKERLKTFMIRHNDSVRGKGLDLVFFNDAVVNLIKVSLTS